MYIKHDLFPLYLIFDMIIPCSNFNKYLILFSFNYYESILHCTYFLTVNIESSRGHCGRSLRESCAIVVNSSKSSHLVSVFNLLLKPALPSLHSLKL